MTHARKRPKAVQYGEGDFDLLVKRPGASWERNTSFPTRGTRSRKPRSNQDQIDGLVKLFLAGGIKRGKHEDRSYNPHAVGAGQAAIVPRGAQNFKDALLVWNGSAFEEKRQTRPVAAAKTTQAGPTSWTCWICFTEAAQKARVSAGQKPNQTIVPDFSSEHYRDWYSRFLAGGVQEYERFLDPETAELPMDYLAVRYLKFVATKLLHGSLQTASKVYFYRGTPQPLLRLDLDSWLVLTIGNPGEVLTPDFFRNIL